MALANQRPEVLDKLDVDQIIDELADSLGVPPSIVRADEAVEDLRQARAAAQKQQAAAAQQQQQADTVKTLADTQLDGNNALTALMRGYGAA